MRRNVGKHKIRLMVSPEVEEIWHKTFTKSIRNRVLQKLVLLWYNLWLYQDSELRQTIERRLMEKGLNPRLKANYVYEVKPEEVMKILNCSKRTAVEYIDALKIISL